MAIKQVEPLKFKGNKVWYLHKLSEKGADAIKCEYPNGDDTFTETTLQAAIEELAANGGGGSSTPSAQPDRVIIIDTTLAENIEGKAYSTFSAAKTYMEANPGTEEHPLYYCVELPAGEFSEQITLDEKWLIHGNNTVLTTPIISTIMISPSNIDLAFASIMTQRIESCTISAGFVGASSMSELPSSVAVNCIIKDTTSTTQYPYVLVAVNCIVNCDLDVSTMAILLTTCCNVLSVNGYMLQMSNSYIQKFACTDFCTAVGCIIGSTQHYLHASSSFVNCYFALETILSILSSRSTSLNGCQGNIDLQVNGSDAALVSISNSQITLKIKALNTLDWLFIHPDSQVIIADNSAGTIKRLSAAANSRFINTVPITITNNQQPNLYMYSTDGGSTMTDDPTSATHLGMIKEPNEIFQSAPTVSDYIWIPLS